MINVVNSRWCKIWHLLLFKLHFNLNSRARNLPPWDARVWRAVAIRPNWNFRFHPPQADDAVTSWERLQWGCRCAGTVAFMTLGLLHQRDLPISGSDLAGSWCGSGLRHSADARPCAAPAPGGGKSPAPLRCWSLLTCSRTVTHHLITPEFHKCVNAGHCDVKPEK